MQPIRLTSTASATSRCSVWSSEVDTNCCMALGIVWEGGGAARPRTGSQVVHAHALLLLLLLLHAGGARQGEPRASRGSYQGRAGCGVAAWENSRHRTGELLAPPTCDARFHTPVTCSEDGRKHRRPTPDGTTAWWEGQRGFSTTCRRSKCSVLLSACSCPSQRRALPTASLPMALFCPAPHAQRAERSDQCVSGQAQHAKQEMTQAPSVAQRAPHPQQMEHADQAYQAQHEKPPEAASGDRWQTGGGQGRQRRVAAHPQGGGGGRPQACCPFTSLVCLARRGVGSAGCRKQAVHPPLPVSGTRDSRYPNCLPDSRTRVHVSVTSLLTCRLWCRCAPRWQPARV